MDQGIVNAEHGLNIRETPSINGKVVGTIPFGLLLDYQDFVYLNSFKNSPYMVTKKDNKTWLHLNYQGVKGFIAMDYLVY